MKIEVVKYHSLYPKGIHEVDGARGKYLISVKIAKPVDGEKVEGEASTEKVEVKKPGKKAERKKPGKKAAAKPTE